MDRDYDVRSHAPERFCRHMFGQEPVNQHPSFVFNRDKQPRIRAGSAQRRSHWAFCKANGLAGKQIGGHDAERNPHLFECLDVGKPPQKSFEAFIRRHAHSRDRPAAKIPEVRQDALAFQFVQRGTSRISGTHQRANARPREKINGNSIFFEDSEHAQMRDSPRESSAERYANHRTAFGLRFAIREGANAFDRRSDPPQDVTHAFGPLYIEHFTAPEVASDFRLTTGCPFL